MLSVKQLLHWMENYEISQWVRLCLMVLKSLYFILLSKYRLSLIVLGSVFTMSCVFLMYFLMVGSLLLSQWVLLCHPRKWTDLFAVIIFTILAWFFKCTRVCCQCWLSAGVYIYLCVPSPIIVGWRVNWVHVTYW